MKAVFDLWRKSKARDGQFAPAASLGDSVEAPANAHSSAMSPALTKFGDSGADGREILKQLIRVTERFPRDYDFMYRALIDMLRSYEGKTTVGPFWTIWTNLVNDIITSPQWLDLLFPEQCAADPTLVSTARTSHYRTYSSPGPVSPASLHAREAMHVPAELMLDLLRELALGDPGHGPPFLFLSRFYFFRDILYGYFVDTSLKGIQRAIFHQCYLQRHNWRQSYAADYPYQGMERLGISGIKPTEERLARYDITEYLRASDQLLDIGSNNGLWALGVASKVAHIDAIEFNPYLVSIGNAAKEHLRTSNVSFMVADFIDFIPDKQYDACCSLANHCTIDGNLSIGFEQYIAKVFRLLKPGGILFFESHNVFGPGTGGAGDDGDLDAKFDIAERYFSILKYKMTPAYVPAFDIDKLFVVMRRRDDYDPAAIRSLSLLKARDRYGY